MQPLNRELKPFAKVAFSFLLRSTFPAKLSTSLGLLSQEHSINYITKFIIMLRTDTYLAIGFRKYLYLINPENHFITVFRLDGNRPVKVARFRPAGFDC
jgi:hypothetical protein